MTKILIKAEDGIVEADSITFNFMRDTMTVMYGDFGKTFKMVRA